MQIRTMSVRLPRLDGVMRAGPLHSAQKISDLQRHFRIPAENLIARESAEQDARADVAHMSSQFRIATMRQMFGGRVVARLFGRNRRKQWKADFVDVMARSAAMFFDDANERTLVRRRGFIEDHRNRAHA